MCRKLIYLVSFVLVLALVSNASADLVSQYQLEDNVLDSVGTNHGDSLHGGVFVNSTAPVPSGTTKAAQLGGDTWNRVNIPTDGFSGAAGTVAGWFNHSSAALSHGRYLFGNGEYHTYGRIQLYMTDSDRQLNLGLGDDHFKATDIYNFGIDTWYHVALTWDSGDYDVYVSSSTAGDMAHISGTYTGLTAFGGNAHIGNTGDEPGVHNDAWVGDIDEVRIYDNALSQAQVGELVPEPATIALLGLGGLALLRRKR